MTKRMRRINLLAEVSVGIRSILESAQVLLHQDLSSQTVSND